MRTSWLAALMVLSIASVVTLGVWDETREAAAALEDFAREQATLAAVTSAGLSSQLESVRRDALATAAEAAQGRAVTPAIANDYLALRVRPGDAPAPRFPVDPQSIALRVPVADGRVVDLVVPITRLVPGDAWLAHVDAIVLALPPGERLFRRPDGRTLRADAVRSALDEGQPWVRLSRTEAAALGLPARMAVAGLASVHGSALGPWGVAVVASAHRERDREARARWRLVLGVLVVAGLIGAFGSAALRTQRKELELERALALADLQRARDEQLARENRAAMMVTLAAGVAHEVSTPLSVIAGRAEQLEARASAGDERARRAVQVILEQSARIREVIRGFLRLARGDAPVLDRVEPATVVQAAATLVEHRFAKAGVQLTVQTTGELPAIRGDAQLLEQAVVNLLLNACDACPRGGHVTVATEADATHVTFVVLDDGEGISPENAARVVEPFFSTKPGDKGTGLGLAIANEIAKIHRGGLALAPRSTRGTRATIRVPTEQPAPATTTTSRQEEADAHGSG